MTLLRPALLTVLVVAIDLWTKAMARHLLVPGGSIDLVPGVSLGLSYNTGMAFGLLQGQRWLLLVGGAVIVAGLIFWLRRERGTQSRAGLSLILGGALGNLIDRFARDAVTDFIDLQGFGYQWPTFNLADTALTVGVLLLLFDRRARSKPVLPKEFTPALGASEFSSLYDLSIALLTREQVWRRALLAQLDPRPGDVILDVGCGTGTFAVMIKQMCPDCEVVGIDPDPDILARAAEKARNAGVTIRFEQGFARDADRFGPVFTKVVSSLVFHQTPMAEKAAGLSAIRRALRSDGSLHIADYGLQRTALMRLLFRIIQRVDGHANTQPNAEGVLPVLMEGSQFEAVTERLVVPTATGSISLYFAVRGGRAVPTDDFTDQEEAVRTWLIALDWVDAAADVRIWRTPVGLACTARALRKPDAKTPDGEEILAMLSDTFALNQILLCVEPLVFQRPIELPRQRS